MFKNLRNKFLILNMSIISVVLIAAFSVVYITTYSNIQVQNDSRLNNLAIAPSFLPLPSGGENGYIINGISSDEYGLSFTIVLDEIGNLTDSSSLTRLPSEVFENAAEIIRNGTNNNTVTIADRKWLYKISALDTMQSIRQGSEGKTIINEIKSGTRATFLDVTDSNKMLTQLFLTFVIIGILTLFVVFFISLYFANRAIFPIKTAFLKQKQFVADASHELKTPIASITANSDALLAHKEQTIESQSRWIEYIKAETERMSRLVGDMLELAKTDESKPTNILPIDISRVTENSIASLEAVIYEKGLTLRRNIAADIIFSCDGERLSQVALILLDNAVKYTKSGGTITVLLEQKAPDISLTVKNTSDPIPKEEITKLFDRFYRADQSREHSGGYGLGLSIAKAVVQNMGGKIYAGYEDGEMIFTIHLR